MPQSKEAHRDYMRKLRGSQSITQKEGFTAEGSQDIENPEGSHPIMKYLVPGENRKKMEAIVTKLREHKQLENVYLGCGSQSLPLDIVAEMLECTK